MSDATTRSETVMDCSRVIRDEIADRYVAGRLNADDAAAFEEHYFTCPRCFEEMEAWRRMRTALDRTGGASRPAPAILRRAWLWPVAAAAVILIGLTIFQSRRQDAPPQRAAGPAPAPQPPPEMVTARLAELSAVTAAPYQPARLRGASDEAVRQFQQAMTRYQAADYAGAAQGLEVAARLDAGAPSIQFYLGICHLLTGDADRAIERLNATIALGPSAYVEEAQFHLAKALLRKGDVAGARSALTKTVELKGDREADAQRLLRDLASLDPRAGGSQ